MESNNYSKLSDQELLEEQKKLKSAKLINGFLIGIFIGVAIYSAATKGIGFFTFFPLFFIYLLINSRKKSKKIDNELNKRNLK